MVDGATHVSSLEDRPILFEKTLVISQMVGIDFKEVPNEWKTLEAWYLAHRLPIDCDADDIFTCGDLGHIMQYRILR